MNNIYDKMNNVYDKINNIYDKMNNVYDKMNNSAVYSTESFLIICHKLFLY